MIQIKPIKLGLPPKEATQLLVRPLINSTTDTECNTYYEVLTENNEVLANGNLPINEEQYEEWARQQFLPRRAGILISYVVIRDGAPYMKSDD